METKICSKCKEEKLKSTFYRRKDSPDGYRSDCKKCFLSLNKKKYLESKDKIIEKSKNYYYLNKETIAEKRKEYHKNNKEKKKQYIKNNLEEIKEKRKIYRQKNIETFKLKKKEYREKNKEKIREYMRGYNSNRIKTDFIYKLTTNIRSRIRQFLKQKGIKKNSKTFDLVGCSPQELKEHLEKQFISGMSWELIGKKIHIDHIIPLSSAKTEDEIYKLCHYTNLQPLWAEDNLKKGNKIL